jgi:uncharacterized protein (TIGR03083 family)
MNELWDLVEDERRDLAALLASLTEAEWDHPSLCEGWRIREVVAHLIWVPTVTRGAVFMPLLKAGWSVPKLADKVAKQRGSAPATELLAGFAATLGDRRLPPRTTTASLLADLFIHHQDIRRPLGLTRHVDEERLHVVLDRTVWEEATRCRGITIRATDMEFEHGSGPVVEGLAEALIMTLSGRSAVLTELGGPGFEPLAARLAVRPA